MLYKRLPGYFVCAIAIEAKFGKGKKMLKVDWSGRPTEVDSKPSGGKRAFCHITAVTKRPRQEEWGLILSHCIKIQSESLVFFHSNLTSLNALITYLVHPAYHKCNNWKLAYTEQRKNKHFYLTLTFSRRSPVMSAIINDDLYRNKRKHTHTKKLLNCADKDQPCSHLLSPQEGNPLFSCFVA